MSIIDKERAAKMKARPATWFETFIDGITKKNVTKDKTVKAEDGSESVVPVTLKKTEFDADAALKLLEVNHLDPAPMRAMLSQKNGPGRVAMGVRNMLRPAARKRHGLFDLKGNWNDAGADFLNGAERTEEHDGTKIPKAKPEGEAAKAA